ncbi:hypothetical protein COLO4_37139 [Corchorus olitorius]|uniref:Uncharacterized protein n=1 Tax=Corchorus olitorius TaxID=93759 RepID=A0A1R3G358_9ROSI|nr:hypothetical protein COLO4_37139 [Corchorus olitorius]
MSYHQPRQQRQQTYRHDHSRRRLPPRVPHHSGSSSWQPLPLWEKKFCVKVGGMSWKRFLESKRNLDKSDDHKVYGWNDSGGKQAFDDAKQRFWANWHGLTRYKPLPSPDLYIDQIDWNRNSDINGPHDYNFSNLSDDEEQEKLLLFAEYEEITKRLSNIPWYEIKPTGWEIFDYAPQLPTLVGS